MQALTFDIGPWRWLTCQAAGVLTPRAYWSVLSGLRLRQVSVPALPADDWVRLRTLMGGICGTDLALLMLRHHPGSVLRAFTPFPITLGHENVAVVDAVGGDAEDIAIGTRVCVEPALSCVPRGISPVCRECGAGRFSLCESFVNGRLPRGTMIGLNGFTSGSWAPYFVAHRSALHPVPDTVDDASAVLVDPVACALHVVMRRPPAAEERVAVIGGGMMALGVVIVLRALDLSCHVSAIVRHDHQRRLLLARGVDEALLHPRSMSMGQRYEAVARAVGGRRVRGPFGNQAIVGGFDVVYDCIGTGSSLTDALKFVRPRGTVMECGTSQIALVDTTPLWFSEVTMIGAFGRAMEHGGFGSGHTYELVLDLLRRGKLDLSGLLTHTFALRDYRKAFGALNSRARHNVFKAAFVHDPP